MGLTKMWRRVRGTLAERTHNLLAISDLHLGADLKSGMKPAQLLRPRPIDAPLAAFLDHHASHRTNGKPWRLILNGDIVDFVAITMTPAPGAAVPFEVRADEREDGLAPEESKCVWKLQRTVDRHPLVFDALARFLQKGNSVHIIRGNHDAEFRWPAVQAEFRRLLALRCGGMERRLARNVVFHDWFYLEPGFFYAEHGNAHDHYSVQDGFFEEHRQAAGEMNLPLSSQVVRYFVNRYSEQVDMDDADTWGVKEYLDWVLKAGNPLRVAADYFVMVFRVLYPILRQSLKLSRAFWRAADKAIAPVASPHVRQMLARFQGTEKQAQQLIAMASRPAEQSLFDSMQLFYLDRMLLALVSLGGAWSLSSMVHGFWAKAGALTGVGILFAALNVVLGGKRRTDAHPMLLQAARRVAQVFDVRYIVMGHSHRPLELAVGNGARYYNLGAWTRGSDGFPHVRVENGVAELRRWKLPAPQSLPVPALVPQRTVAIGKIKIEQTAEPLAALA